MPPIIERHEYTGRRRVCGTCGRTRRAQVHIRQYRETTELVQFTRRMVRALGRRAGADVDALPELAGLARDIDEQLARAVAAAHAEGYSWADIAGRLGVSRQAAFKRFAGRAEELAAGQEAGA